MPRRPKLKHRSAALIVANTMVTIFMSNDLDWVLTEIQIEGFRPLHYKHDHFGTEEEAIAAARSVALDFLERQDKPG